MLQTLRLPLAVERCCAGPTRPRIPMLQPETCMAVCREVAFLRLGVIAHAVEEALAGWELFALHTPGSTPALSIVGFVTPEDTIVVRDVSTIEFAMQGASRA